MLHDKIYTYNVSVVRVNGTILKVGEPTDFTLSSTGFGTKSHMFGSCKGHVAACFRVCQFASIRLMVQVSDITCRTIGFVLLMYPLYG